MKYKIFPPQAIYELGQRGNQEDWIYPSPKRRATAADRLFIVCDGMGGHERGEVASHAVAETLGGYIAKHCDPNLPFTDDMLALALEAAYDRLDALDRGEARKMGTTLTLLHLHRGGVTAAHIGDSRIYHLRPNRGEIRYISRDHSLVMELYQAGEITREEMATHPGKYQIVRAMTPGPDRVRADVVHITDVKPDDYFYLCSDGMLEQMSDDELLSILADNITDDEKRDALLRATADNKDNHSAYLIHIDKVISESIDASQPNDEDTSRYNALNIHRRREAEPNGDVSVVGNADVSLVAPEIAPPPHAARPSEPSRSPSSERQFWSPDDAEAHRSRLPLWLGIGGVAALAMAAGGYWLFGNKQTPPETEQQPPRVIVVAPADEQFRQTAADDNTSNTSTSARGSGASASQHQQSGVKGGSSTGSAQSGGGGDTATPEAKDKTDGNGKPNADSQNGSKGLTGEILEATRKGLKQKRDQTIKEETRKSPKQDTPTPSQPESEPESIAI